MPRPDNSGLLERQFVTLATLALLLVLAVTASAKSSGLAPRNESASSDTFRTRVMFWALPTPILCKEWYVVIAGTVLETHLERTSGFAKKRFTAGTLKVELVLLSLPTKKESAPADFEYFKSDGFEGLKPGNKVVVFVNEYDDGYGIVEASGSNCKLGLTVRDWSDPIVGAIQAITRDQRMAKHPYERKRVLEDANYRELWRPYSGNGIDSILADESCRATAVQTAPEYLMKKLRPVELPEGEDAWALQVVTAGGFSGGGRGGLILRSDGCLLGPHDAAETACHKIPPEAITSLTKLILSVKPDDWARPVTGEMNSDGFEYLLVLQRREPNGEESKYSAYWFDGGQPAVNILEIFYSISKLGLPR